MNTHCIKKSLKRLKLGKKIPWSQMSCLLNAIDETEYWSNSSNSFTEWLINNTELLGLMQSTLWRYLAVGKYYRNLRDRFTWVKLEFTPLERLPPHVSAEKLEILEKLGRAAPNATFEPIIELVLNNKISRDELRSRWQAFRPALQGATARGRDVIAPRINADNLEQRASVFEALVINALNSDGAKWLTQKRPIMYQLKTHIWPDYDNSKSNTIKYEFDAVVILKKDEKSQLEVHGIEIVNIPKFNPQKLNDMASHCDYLWVATHCGLGSVDFLIDIPDCIGLIEIENDQVTVICDAGAGNKNNENTEALLKALLLKETRK